MYEKCTVKGGNFSEKAWAPFAKQFKFLSSFCGGPETLFPGTEKVECDFSNKKFDKKEHSSNLTNLSLEGVLQSKQFKPLRKMNHT